MIICRSVLTYPPLPQKVMTSFMYSFNRLMIHNDTDSDTDTNISININNLYYIEFIDDFVGEKMEILQNCLTLSYFYHYICLYYFCLVSLKLVELVSI